MIQISEIEMKTVDTSACRVKCDGMHQKQDIVSFDTGVTAVNRDTARTQMCDMAMLDYGICQTDDFSTLDLECFHLSESRFADGFYRPAPGGRQRFKVGGIRPKVDAIDRVAR